MTKRRKLLLWFFLSLAGFIGFIGLYTKFEYTLVPELRERMGGAGAIEGVALGKLLFESRGCSGCHTLGDLSDSTIGPDLTAIASTMSASEIETSIVNPEAAISVNCLNGPCDSGLMPAFGDILDDREIAALVAFLLEYGRRDL